MESRVERVFSATKSSLLQIEQLPTAEAALNHGRIQPLQKRCPQTRRIGASISCQQVGQISLEDPSEVSASTCKLARYFTRLGRCFLSFAVPGGKMVYHSIAPINEAEACRGDFDMHMKIRSAGMPRDQEEKAILQELQG